MRENLKLSDYRTFVRDYWKLVGSRYKGPLLIALLWILMMQVVALAEPYAVKYVIDDVLSHKADTIGKLVSILGLLFGVLFLGNVVQVAKNWRIVRIQLMLDRDIPKDSTRKLLALPLSFHERENAGLLASKVIKGTSRAGDVTSMLLYEILALIVQTGVTAVVIGFISPKALGVFAVVVTGFSTLTVYVKQRLAPQRRRRHDEDSHADELFGQAIVNIATVKAFAQEKREYGAISGIRDGIFTRALSEFRTSRNLDLVRNVIINLGRSVVVGLCAWSAIGGSMTMGTFVFVVALTDKVFLGCYRIGAIFDRVQEASESVNKIVTVLETEEAIKDPSNPVEAPGFKGAISFRGVTYLYPEKLPDEQEPQEDNNPALSDIDLEIKPGEMIAIVGPSGCGKSTLIKLLMRLNGDPMKGEIRIDGIDLRLMRRSDFLRQFGYVPQEVEVFDKKVDENIAYSWDGREIREADHKEIVSAAEVADIHGFIEGLKKGYATRVGNRGMRLSGGQRQRLGIARAVLKKPPILIFDEATSHVDSITEERIHRSMAQLREGRTVIVTAHRLSTIRDADRIVVMEKGRIIEIGTHAQLFRNQGLYTRLVTLQQKMESKL